MLTDVNYHYGDYFTVFKNMKSLCCPHEANTILYVNYASLACCDSWGRKESDVTERLNCTEEKHIFF